jgi:hypothetical protein
LPDRTWGALTVTPVVAVGPLAAPATVVALDPRARFRCVIVAVRRIANGLAAFRGRLVDRCR